MASRKFTAEDDAANATSLRSTVARLRTSPWLSAEMAVAQRVQDAQTHADRISTLANIYVASTQILSDRKAIDRQRQNSEITYLHEVRKAAQSALQVAAQEYFSGNPGAPPVLPITANGRVVRLVRGGADADDPEYDPRVPLSVAVSLLASVCHSENIQLTDAVLQKLKNQQVLVQQLMHFSLPAISIAK